MSAPIINIRSSGLHNAFHRRKAINGCDTTVQIDRAVLLCQNLISQMRGRASIRYHPSLTCHVSRFLCDVLADFDGVMGKQRQERRPAQ